MDDFNSTVNALTEGLRDLPTDDVARVKHFLAEYLGDTRHPVPFGGRAKDFARLDSWLVEQAGPPYALLAAPAGRGKSALLLRWCQRLLARSDLAVVYFPVSIRFRTNLAGVIFPSLVALLAKLHGENIPSDLHTHEDIWHGLLTEYITRPLPDGRQLLLVLDGIDEAADWDAGPWLLPTHPPAHLRVILSARYLANDLDANAWLTRLGWTREGLAQTLELYPLDRAGIASVLVQMGFPLDLLSTRIDIVSELHRLSEGDPLLIRLYVDDLWERGDAATRLTPEDLHTIRPGLPGYFERWWNEQRSLWDQDTPQREAAVQTVLNLLAGALGPLSKADIIHLSSDASVLSEDQIERHLAPLKRFVIGDGMHQGYVFSHPRLASYFLEERLNKHERQRVEQRFLSWGARTLAELNANTPEKASPYIVHYYGAHLERAQTHAHSFFALVSDGWRRAWEKLDRANAGFLSDSERAWRAAERENRAALSNGQIAPYLDVEIRSLLCRVSINTMTNNIAPRLMLEAVKTGCWTPAQGLASIRLIADATPRARELVGLAPSVQEPLRTDILQEALDTIASLKYERDRLDALVELAPGFSVSLLEQIVEIIHAIEDEADRAGMLAELAPTLAESPELLERVLNIALEIEEEEYLVLALEGLLPYLNREQKEQILRQFQALKDDRYRTQALTALVPYLPTPLLADILAESQMMVAGIPQVRLLTTLVGVLPQPAREEALQATLELLNDIIDQEYRAEMLVKLAPYLSIERLQLVLAEIQTHWDENYRARALLDLRDSIPEEQLPTLLESVLAIKNEEQRVTILLHVLPRLSEKLQTTILEHVPVIWDEGRRVEMLAQLARTVQADLRPRLLELAHAIKDPGYRIWLLAELEISLASNQSDPEIAETFLAIEHTNERIQTLLAIIERVSDEALRRILALLEPEIFGFHLSLQQAERKADIFAKLAPRMPQTWLTRTLQRVKMMEKETAQVQVLVALAPRIDEHHLATALDIVRAMRTRDKRSQVLEALVSTLPQEKKGERVREMLQVLQIIKDEYERASLFGALIAHIESTLPATRVQEVLLAITAMRSETLQASILTLLAPHLSVDQFAAVLDALPAMSNEEERSRVLTAFVPYLPEHLTPRFFATIQGLAEERWQVNTLMTVATHVSPATLLSLLALVQAIQDPNAQTRILGVLAAHMPEAAFPRFWDVLQALSNKSHQVWILNALATHVPAEYFTAFWEAVQQVKNRDWKMSIVAKMAAHPPENSFPQLWEAIQQSSDDFWLATAIAALAPSIPEASYPQVFQKALALPNTQLYLRDNLEGKQGSALDALANHVPVSFFLQFWHTVRSMDDRLVRSILLQKLVTQVPDSCFAEIWNTINLVEEHPQRQEQLYERLAPRVPERLFGQVWETVTAMEDRWRQSKWLVELASRVPESFIPQFWQIAKNMPDMRKRVLILNELAPKLPEELLVEEIDMALKIASPGPAIKILERLLPLLSEEQNAVFCAQLLPAEWNEEDLRRIFTNMQNKHGWWKQIMVALVPYLPEERLQIILPVLLQVIVGQMKADEDRIDTLKKLVGRVPESVLPTVLETIWSLQMAGGRETILRALLTSRHITSRTWLHTLELATQKTQTTNDVSYLLQVLNAAPIELQQTEREPLYRALHAILHLLAQYPRREVLINLTSLEPTLRASGGEAATIAIACAGLEIGHWWP